MCIVANSLRSFRVTYAFLNVLDAKTTDMLQPKTIDNSGLNQTTQLDTLKNDLLVAQSFFDRNKFVIILFCLVVTGVVVVVTLGFCFCCFQLMRGQKSKKMDGKKRCAGLGDEMPDTEKMNSLLEKTMTSMRKVSRRFKDVNKVDWILE